MRIAILTAVLAVASIGLAREPMRFQAAAGTLDLPSSRAVLALAEAQSPSGGVASTPDITISGKVKNQKGKPAVAATVTLRDTVTGEQRSTKTDKRGRYSFAKVFPGEYSLSASLQDKKSPSKDISVHHTEKLQEDLRIQND
ncbi:MAG TPA: carboxypeptidase-like regulatory domain-containing protein [Candidatus Acidoferrales bacterium]|nr:carboxypeptidase-like regulatory domain-containing protein [Candidatus Acidoferrales bacterium]